MPYKPLRELKPELFADEGDKLAMLAIEDPESEDDDDILDESDTFEEYAGDDVEEYGADDVPLLGVEHHDPEFNVQDICREDDLHITTNQTVLMHEMNYASEEHLQLCPLGCHGDSDQLVAVEVHTERGLTEDPEGAWGSGAIEGKGDDAEGFEMGS